MPGRCGRRSRWCDGVERLSAQPPGMIVPATGDIGLVKYHVTATGECLFRRRFLVFDLRLMVLGVKGILSWRDGKLRVMAKVPLCWLAFVASCLLFVTTGAGFVMTVDVSMGWTMLAVAWASTAVYVLVAWRLEMARFSTYLDELVQALGVTYQTAGGGT